MIPCGATLVGEGEMKICHIRRIDKRTNYYRKTITKLMFGPLPADRNPSLALHCDEGPTLETLACLVNLFDKPNYLILNLGY